MRPDTYESEAASRLEREIDDLQHQLARAGQGRAADDVIWSAWVACAAIVILLAVVGAMMIGGSQ